MDETVEILDMVFIEMKETFLKSRHLSDIAIDEIDFNHHENIHL